MRTVWVKKFPQPYATSADPTSTAMDLSVSDLVPYPPVLESKSHIQAPMNAVLGAGRRGRLHTSRTIF